MGYYVASSGNFLPTFRDNLSVPSWGKDSSTLSNNQEERIFSYFAVEAWNH
jgi:hypothetical protein